MSIRNEVPVRHDLFEYVGEEVIGKEGIDHNNHLSYAHYFSICGRQRNLFMKACGIDGEEIRKNLGLRIVVVRDGTFDFKHEVFERDKVNILTSAEVAIAHLRFSQRMIRAGIEVFNLQCNIAVIDANGKTTRLPNIIKERISQANLTKQPKK